MKQNFIIVSSEDAGFEDGTFTTIIREETDFLVGRKIYARTGIKYPTTIKDKSGKDVANVVQIEMDNKQITSKTSEEKDDDGNPKKYWKLESRAIE
jgi:hypothetical protein